MKPEEPLSQTSNLVKTNTAPPLYEEESVELPLHEAERLIANGQAEPLTARVIDDNKDSTPYDNDTESLSENEETWAMGEANTAVAEPGQERTPESPATNTKEKHGVGHRASIISSFPAFGIPWPNT